MLGMRSLQGISHLRSLTQPQKARDRSESNSGSSVGSRSVASRKGNRERPLVISLPFINGEDAKAVTGSRIVTGRTDNERPSISLPVLGPRSSTICAPFLDMNELDKLRAPTLTSTAEVQSPEECTDCDKCDAASTQDTSRNSAETHGAICPSTKRVGGVELWEVSLLDIDHDALRDALEDHPNPLSSNPTSEHDDEEPTTPWTTVSSTTGGPDATEAMASYWQDSPSPCPSTRRRPRPTTFAAASAHECAEPALLPSSPLSRHDGTVGQQLCACATIPQLHREIANLYAGNSALLTLKAAHEETIAILHDNIRNQDTTISRHDETIAELAGRVQAKETDQVSMIENFCAEIASQNREIAQLGEDKWYLMGRVEELELKMAAIKAPLGHDKPESAKPREEMDDNSRSIAAGGVVADDVQDGAREKIPSLAEFSHSKPNSPTFDPTLSTNNDTETPNTMLSALFSPRPRSSVSNRSLYALTQTPSMSRAPSIQISTYVDRQSCPLTTQRRDSNQFLLAHASSMRDGSSMTKGQDRYSRDSQMTAMQVVLEAKARLEQRLADTRQNLDASEARNLELETQITHQATLIQQLTWTSPGPPSTSSAHIPIPDVPVLTYTRSGAVWLDRVTSSFAYLGLLDFIQRDVPRPETSTWDTTEVIDWTSRRLRAVVLLKNAVDDDIIEDVLHLQGRKETIPGERDLIQVTSAMDDPHQLLTTILSLRRIISSTAMDMSWLDRIQSADFDGIESFTSLVLCVDKRHGVMYGTSADHYDALLPKLQETMARLFPDLKGSMFAEDADGEPPRKWRQLPIWMAKVVKKRQISGDS